MNRSDAETLLRQFLGPGAAFRDGQWEAVDRVANQRQRMLLVQRTGWGKSVVYFLATRILREAGAGPTLLISPLLSLMRDQIRAAERLGIRATTIHSQNLEAWPEVESALRENRCDILLISPERLGSSAFLKELLPVIQGSVGLFVVDEAHCISDWGHDFRPDYRRIVRILRLLPSNVPVLCTTATANNRVVADVEMQIPGLQTLRGPLVRHSLKLYCIKLDDQAERLAWLAHFMPRLPGSGIVYCLTIQDARRVSDWLQRQGIAAEPYHADLESKQRIDAERRLRANEVKALVATVALGMGFDKPDLGFVIHFQRPGSTVAYYQQVGRAGRAVDNAFGILLSGREDDEITDYFIRTAFPPLEVMQGVLRVLEQGETLGLHEIGGRLNHSNGVMEKALKLLEVEGAVQHDAKGYARTANPWQSDTARYEQVTRLRYEELAEIRRYVDHPGCLMEFLSRALDDPNAAACGKCMNCTGQTTRQSPPPALVTAAADYLRGDALVLEPRTRWPGVVVGEVQKALPEAAQHYSSGKPKTTIPPSLVSAPGRALCLYGDAGWGREVAQGKYQTGVFSDALVAAAAELIRGKWRPEPPPEWVTAVPSHRHTALVQDFAQRLAKQLELPFLPVLSRAREGRAQKEMQNSAMQLRNVVGAFRVVGGATTLPADASGGASGWREALPKIMRQLASAVGLPPRVPPGAVLLVDDMVDSGWTLTWLAVLLRHHGSGAVHPCALAKATPRGG